MADQKISELTALTGANVADTDLLPIVDTSATETKKITFGEFKTALDTATGFVRITGDTMTGNLSFGDNNKAIFGAGSDLQIFHNGADSYLFDDGTGDLNLTTNGASINLRKHLGGENMLVAVPDGAVTLYYDNAAKLATTATGIDVTGTVTATGTSVFASLDISGDIDVDGTTNLDVVDIDGATQIDATVTVGVDDTGYDVKFFGATAGAYMLWDESADDLILGGAAGLSVNSTALVTGVLTANGGAVFNESGADVDFRVESDTDANALFVQGSDGFVGIGTSSPSYKLHVSGSQLYLTNSGNTELMTTNTSGGTVTGGIQALSNQSVRFGSITDYPVEMAVNNSAKMVIATNGYVGFGVTTPTYMIHLNGGTAGNSNSGIAAAWNVHSDYRLKENVVELSNASSLVSQLRPVKFSWVGEDQSEATTAGFIAHEMAEVAPYSVMGEKDAVNEDGSINSQAADYSKLVPLLTAALQEALIEITALKARVTALEG